MTKKVYIQPAINLDACDMENLLNICSVQTEGLGTDNLTQEETPGNPWEGAVSRRVWGEEE